MITTVTLNVSVDKLYLVDENVPDTVMRVKEVHNTPGGKGLNVAKTARLAGEHVRAIGFLGGFAGDYVRSMLKDMDIESEFTEISGETRSCINIRDMKTGRHTEYLEPGIPVSSKNIEDFLKSYDRALGESTVITISGSVPQGIPQDFYTMLIERGKKAGVPVLLDTSGDLLKNAVKGKPALIKPNLDEIAQLTGRKVNGYDEIVEAAEEIYSSGVEHVVVSLGKHGALVVCDKGVFRGSTPDIPVVNTVGCGDSMLAGFAAGISRGCGIEDTVRLAMAISTANALSLYTGYFRQEDFDRVMPLIDVVYQRPRRQE